MNDVFQYEIPKNHNVFISEIIHSKKLEIECIDQPFFIVNVDNVIESYKKWITYLPSIKPFYAVKCNPNPILLQVLYDLGCNFDCASQSEMELIMNLTNREKPDIIFANPCKFISDIHYAKTHNISWMTFDSEEEFHKMHKYHSDAKPILRLAVNDTPSVTSFNIKFGCPLDKVEKMFQLSKQLGFPIYGLSFHVGSGCSNPLAYKNAFINCKKFSSLAKKYEIIIKIIDIGGGFWAEDSMEFPFLKYAETINESIQELFFEEIQNQSIHFIAEPGRYFAQNTHTLVCNIINKKVEERKREEKRIKYYLNDGIYGSFNCILTDHAKIKFNLFKNHKENELEVELEYPSMIFGPTCDSYDIITGKETILLPEMNCGDYIYIENFGAYTISSSSHFNGFQVKEFYYIYNNELFEHDI